jgi:hypothetical protein
MGRFPGRREGAERRTRAEVRDMGCKGGTEGEGMWRPRKLHGAFMEVPKPSRIACESVVGPPSSSSELSHATLRQQVLRKSEARAIHRKLHAPVALPDASGTSTSGSHALFGPLCGGRPRKCHGAFMEGHKASRIACGSVIGPLISSSEFPFDTFREQVPLQSDVRAIHRKSHAPAALPGASGPSTSGSHALFRPLCGGPGSFTERSWRVPNPRE